MLTYCCRGTPRAEDPAKAERERAQLRQYAELDARIEHAQLASQVSANATQRRAVGFKRKMEEANLEMLRSHRAAVERIHARTDTRSPAPSEPGACKPAL